MSRHDKSKRRRRSTAPQVPPRPPRRPEAAADERPRAPWHPFPLIELSVLIGIVCIVVGFFTRDGSLGRIVLGLGFVLGALGGLDTAVREHWAGYRSHTLVLAAFPAVAAAALTALASTPRYVPPIALVVVFALALGALRRVWERAYDNAR